MTTLVRTTADPSLLAVEHAARALAACTTIDEAKEIRDKALAVREYWRRQRSAGGEAAANAARIVARADLRMGQLLAEAPKAKPPVPPPGPGRGNKSSVPAQDRAFTPAAPVRGAVAQTPAQRPVPTLREQGISRNESSRLQQIARKAEADPTYAEKFVEAQAAKAAKFVSRAPAVSDSPEHEGDTWETPDEVLFLVRNVLGEIDVDPASNAHAQKRVAAKTFYTKQDSGLTHEWHGTVFCNPPYSMPLIQQFTEKLIAEYDAKRTSQAIYLVNASTDPKWFQSLLSRFPVCFTAGRLSFLQRSGQCFGNRVGQAFFYLGKRPARFRDVFNTIGTVVEVMG